MQSAMIFLAQEWRKNDTNLNVKPETTGNIT
jgi:hypothetical protein